MKRFVCLTIFVFPLISFAQKKEIVELQRDVSQVADQVRSSQRSLEDKMLQLEVLLKQALDSANRANQAIAVLQSALNDQAGKVVGPVAGIGAKVDQMGEKFQGLSDSMTDLSARMGKLELKVTDIGTQIKLAAAPPQAPANPAAQPLSSGPPPGMTAEGLYKNALADKSGGNLDQALQEFQDYLRYFSDTSFAPNAQYQIGEIYYQRSDFDNSIKAFDAVLEHFPENSNKRAAAQYMKGMSLLKSGQRMAAYKEFHSVISKFPSSDEARKSKEALKGLGLPYSESRPAPVKGRRR